MLHVGKYMLSHMFPDVEVVGLYAFVVVAAALLICSLAGCDC